MEAMAFVLGLKERHRNYIGRENNMKKNGSGTRSSVYRGCSSSQAEV